MTSPSIPRSASCRHPWALALLVFVSGGVALAAAEVFLRIVNLQVTDWGYNNRKYGLIVTYDQAGQFTRQLPNSAGRFYGVSMRFNSLGMRDREHAREKPVGTRRILILGDSDTVGLG